jgi:hypothetical protein
LKLVTEHRASHHIILNEENTLSAFERGYVLSLLYRICLCDFKVTKCSIL